MAERIYINNDWRFYPEYHVCMTECSYDDGQWEKVRIPHTCAEVPLHYFDESIYQMESCYRRHFTAPEEWKGRRVLLTIDGAAHESEVFLNGHSLGRHCCGYTAYTVDLTDALVYGGENVLAVRVDSRENLNIPPFGYVIDYMTYGGIYRDVYLDICNPIHISDVFVYGKVSCGNGRMKQAPVGVISEIRVHGLGERINQPGQSEQSDRTNEPEQDRAGEREVGSTNPAQTAGDLIIRQSIRKESEETFTVTSEAAADRKLCLRYRLPQAELWDILHPVRYEVKTELLDGEVVLDERRVMVGFREAVFRREGFFLNGRKVKIRGLNRHQCFPYVGYAMPESMQRRDAVILKNELGVNAVRTSHYPQSHYFIDECDRLGLLVFTEIPGWQHIGDENWKKQAVRNVKDMVIQYRNHPSIILWGVRINESVDDDPFYKKTNRMARLLDPSRQTGGVRANKKSRLLEDVYTYNDFSHEGAGRGVLKKKEVTSDMSRPYLISEFNGHMYPTKMFDWEGHRTEHAVRHANVLDTVAAESDIAGCFGWCMFDYNTHKDFGSGDRICYHGVMDMFRNPKMAAAVYASQQDRDVVLEISSTMDIGEHPGGNLGHIWMFTNADRVRMYKNDRFIKEYKASESPYKHLPHGPLAIDDFIGDAIEKDGKYDPADAKKIAEILNSAARFGVARVPKRLMLSAVKLMLKYHLTPDDAVALYTNYVGNWGGASTVYRFEAIKNVRGGEVVKVVTKEPVRELHLAVDTDHTELKETNTYDVAAVRVKVVDQNGNTAAFYNEPVVFEASGGIELIGSELISLSGGVGGTYVRTTGTGGAGKLTIRTFQSEPVSVDFNVSVRADQHS